MSRKKPFSCRLSLFSSCRLLRKAASPFRSHGLPFSKVTRFLVNTSSDLQANNKNWGLLVFERRQDGCDCHQDVQKEESRTEYNEYRCFHVLRLTYLQELESKRLIWKFDEIHSFFHKLYHLRFPWFLPNSEKIVWYDIIWFIAQYLLFLI